MDGKDSKGGASGYLIDRIGGKTATVNGGAPTAATGKIGQGFKFNGTSDCLAISGATTWTTFERTVTAWVNLQSGTTNNVIYGYYGWLGVNVSRQLFNASGSLIKTSNGTITLNKWQHIAIVTDIAKNISYYINGVKDSSTNVSDWTSVTNDNIGCEASWGYAKGKIDDLRVYSRALSITEIQQLYAMGGGKIASSISQGGLNSGLKYWFTLDGNTCGSTYCADKMGFAVSTKNATPSFTVGKIGQGIKTKVGSKDYYAIVHASTVFTKQTQSIWVKVSNPTSPAFQDLFTSYGASNVNGININNGYFQYYNPMVNCVYLVGTTVVKPNTWYHVLTTFDGTTAKLYVNGVSEGTPVTCSPGLTSTQGRIGNYTTCSFNQCGSSVIDDVRVWDRDLSIAEIKQLYAMGGGKIASSPPSVQSGLVGWWTMDGNKTNATQVLDSVGSVNGTKAGGLSMTSGKIGQGVKLDGVNDEIVLTSLQTMLATGSTLTTWFKLSPPAGNCMIFGSTGSVYPLYFNTTLSYFSSSGGGVNLSYTPQFDNKWHHAVLVREGLNNVQLYIDGVGKGSKATVNALDSQVDEFGGAGGSFFCKESLDDIRLYNRALSTTEIQQLYNMGK